MKLYNNSSEFKIQYNGFEFEVPNGWFEVKTDHLKQFIINKAKNRWGIEILESEPTTESVVVEPVKEVVEDVAVEEKTEVVSEKKVESKKAKKSKKIEDLENSL